MAGKSPSQFVSELLEKLAGASRHVSFLLGAGTSKAVGLPDVPELGERVGKDVAAQNEDLGKLYTQIIKGRNVEDALSWVRSLAGVLRGTKGAVQGIDSPTATKLDGAICRSIAGIVSQEPPSGLRMHRAFGGWLGRAEHHLPVEVFTLNYDLLLERGLEAAGVPYFDGFAGTFEGRFRTDLVDSTGAGTTGRLDVPPGWVRLWKLHGSVSWRVRRFSNQATSESSTNGYICRVGTSVAPSDSSEDILAIYPSEEKYQESRRVPFTTLFDRFRRALSTPESVTVVCGYSFSDQDINEIIFDAVERFPRSEVVALFFNDISETVSSRAKTSSNLSAAGAKGAILNGREREWEPEPTKYGFWEAETFRLGDFRCLIETLVGGRESPPEIENGS